MMRVQLPCNSPYSYREAPYSYRGPTPPITPGRAVRLYARTLGACGYRRSSVSEDLERSGTTGQFFRDFLPFQWNAERFRALASIRCRRRRILEQRGAMLGNRLIARYFQELWRSNVAVPCSCAASAFGI